MEKVKSWASTGIWWICPSCGIGNHDGGCLFKGTLCIGCKKSWCYKSLEQKGVEMSYPSVEWECECGKKNLIIPKEKYPELPRVSSCGDCGVEHELKFKNV